jgi:hypothetical protein
MPNSGHQFATDGFGQCKVQAIGKQRTTDSAGIRDHATPHTWHLAKAITPFAML